MKVPSILTLSLLITALATAANEPGSIKAAATPSSPSGEAVARVGEIDVKLDEIKAALANLSEQELTAIGRDPSLLSQVVRSLLMQRLLLREAEGKSWAERPEVKAQLERSRQAVITESYLQSVAVPPGNWPAESDLSAFYEANKASFLVPKQYRLAQIYLAVPKAAEKSISDKALAKLEMVKKKLAEKGSDFAAVAKSESEEASSAANGGEIGWLAEAQITPEIRTQALALTAGQISDPIRLNDGWHILKLIETKEAFTPTLEQLKPQLTERLRAERTQANSQAYLAKLLQDNPVSINELALGKALGK